MVTNKKKQAARQRGVDGEAAAVHWYRRAGYEILAQNWRCFEGEIDVIAKRGKTIAICEVKARAAGSPVHPALAISRTKQARVRTAAFRWLEAQPRPGRLRFDAAFVVNGKVQMFEGAF